MKTVDELIKELQQYPPGHYVIQAKDLEGNGFHEWYDIDIGIWNEDEHHDDAFKSYIFDDPDDDNTERLITLDESNCICLWP